MRERKLKRECELGYTLLTSDFLQNSTLYKLYIIYFSEDTLIAAELITNAAIGLVRQKGETEDRSKDDF